MFWIRFDRLHGQLVGLNDAWPERLQFMKAYQALELSMEQRMMVTAALEAVGKAGSIDELRMVSIKIMDVAETCP